MRLSEGLLIDYIGRGMRAWLRRARDWVWLEGDPGRDRIKGLIISGVLEIIFGVIAFCIAMLLLIIVSTAGLSGMKPSHFWMIMGCLFGSTVWLIWMGLGSIRARRWARALVLVGSWISVLFGAFAMALVLYVLPELLASLMDSAGIEPANAMKLLYLVVISMLLLLLFFPLAAIGFYSLAGVGTTCERINPNPCWTDRQPLPLLALGVVSVLGSLSVFAGVTVNHVVFVYGIILSGFPGMLVVLVISLACAYVAWGAINQKKQVWWVAYALVLLTSSSMMLTFSELDMKELFQHMNYSHAQIEALSRSSLATPTTLTIASCIWGVMASIYLVWVRDSFMPKETQTMVKAYSTRAADEKDGGVPERPRAPRMRTDH